MLWPSQQGLTGAIAGDYSLISVYALLCQFVWLYSAAPAEKSSLEEEAVTHGTACRDVPHLRSLEEPGKQDLPGHHQCRRLLFS